MVSRARVRARKVPSTKDGEEDRACSVGAAHGSPSSPGRRRDHRRTPRVAMTRHRIEVAGWTLSVATIFGSLFALGFAAGGCQGDGSGNPFDPGWTRSWSCRALGFPHFPGTVSSLLLSAALYVLPSVVAIVGSIVAVRRESSALIKVCALVCAISVVAALIFGFSAHVSYRGVG